MRETDGHTACRNPFRRIMVVTKGVAMSSRKHRVSEVVNLIRTHKGEPDADRIITSKTGYSKAFVSALRSDMENGRYHEEEPYE